MKQPISLLLGGLVVLSVGLNLVLWSRLSYQGNQLKSAQAAADNNQGLRQKVELQASRTSAPDSPNKDTLELARLRNEVARLRNEAGEAAAWRTQAAEAAQLRAQLAKATRDLALTEDALADATKLSPEELQQMKEEAHAVACVNNLKQIGLAARIWAADHNDVLPPDILSMKDGMATPKILFCPADATATPVTEWSQLDLTSISYRFLNPNGKAGDETTSLATCRIHGYVCLSDGSVRR